MKLSFEILEVLTESNEKMYGGKVYLNNNIIKFIPIGHSLKKIEKYINILKKGLKVVQQDGFIWVIYTDSKGQNMEYWNNIEYYH